MSSLVWPGWKSLDGTEEKSQGQIIESFVSQAKGGELPGPEGKAA